jgi:hypothetical protein
MEVFLFASKPVLMSSTSSRIRKSPYVGAFTLRYTDVVSSYSLKFPKL